jgi:hypothetical protein
MVERVCQISGGIILVWFWYQNTIWHFFSFWYLLTHQHMPNSCRSRSRASRKRSPPYKRTTARKRSYRGSNKKKSKKKSKEKQKEVKEEGNLTVDATFSYNEIRDEFDVSISVYKGTNTETNEKIYEAMRAAYGPRLKYSERDGAAYSVENEGMKDEVLHFTLYTQPLNTKTQKDSRPSTSRPYDIVLKIEREYLWNAIGHPTIIRETASNSETKIKFITTNFKLHTNWTLDDHLRNWSLRDREDFIFETFVQWLHHGEQSEIILPTWLIMYNQLKTNNNCESLDKRFENAWKHLNKEQRRTIMGVKERKDKYIVDKYIVFPSMRIPINSAIFDGLNKNFQRQQLNQWYDNKLGRTTEIWVWDAVNLRGGVLTQINTNDDITEMYIVQTMIDMMASLSGRSRVITFLSKLPPGTFTSLVMTNYRLLRVFPTKMTSFLEDREKTHEELDKLLASLQTPSNSENNALNEYIYDGKIILPYVDRSETVDVTTLDANQLQTVGLPDWDAMTLVNVNKGINKYSVDDLTKLKSILSQLPLSKFMELDWYLYLNDLIESAIEDASGPSTSTELPPSPFSPHSPEKDETEAATEELIYSYTSSTDAIVRFLMELNPKVVIDISPYEISYLNGLEQKISKLTSESTHNPLNVLMVSKSEAFKFSQERQQRLVKFQQEHNNLRLYWCVLCIPYVKFAEGRWRVYQDQWKDNTFTNTENNHATHALYTTESCGTEKRAALYQIVPGQDRFEISPINFEDKDNFSHALTEYDDYIIEKVCKTLRLNPISQDTGVKDSHLTTSRRSNETAAYVRLLDCLAKDIKVVLLTVQQSTWEQSQSQMETGRKKTTPKRLSMRDP